MKKKIPTKQIGDNRLPNRYWVSISNDYYYLNEDYWEWIDTLSLFKSDGKTIARFNTFKEAMGLVGDLPFGEKYEDIQINHISIEDRISGQVYEKTNNFDPLSCSIHTTECDDTQFTKDTMEKRGKVFK